jgi:lactococcin 972 family bacteriocin
MKTLGTSLSCAAAVAALTAGALAPATPAQAAAPAPKESGMVAIPVNPSSGAVSSMTVTDVGGGTWSYGTAIASDGRKICYSNYIHPYLYHSSTVILAAGTEKDYADGGAWSRANLTAGHVYTCYAYWATYKTAS